MVISAKAVRKPRRAYVCGDCRQVIDGPHLYLYGMAHTGEKPYALRLHTSCILMPENDKKILAAWSAASKMLSDLPEESEE